MKVFITVLLFITPLFIYSQNSTIKLLTDDNFPPYSYVVDDKIVGYDIDVIREIESRLGLTISVEAVPWNRLLKYIESGQVDGGFSLFKNSERESWAKFTSIPIHRSRFTIFTRKDNQFVFNNLDDLIGKNIGLDRGFLISDEFDELKSNKTISVIESEDASINFKLLENKRIDCYIGNYFTSLYVLNMLDKLDEFSIIKRDLVPSRSAYLVFSKKSKIGNIDALIARITKTLEELEIDGTLERISKKYISN
ncbi:substrate-binding periplasmic protein [Thiospirochaeta perfilievii]|uniref:substrate-binding periplasmic protein n=1 Tax=Thiospirochaeta perfilievii TaxID=252967 RepID=UPI001659E958|nr:transporter substrate-binding domain-containing protein [Thiospirochaeta perfilievii]